MEHGVVGLERLELSTSRLSGVRSNHLSYRPLCRRFWPLAASCSGLSRSSRSFYTPFAKSSPSLPVIQNHRPQRSLALYVSCSCLSMSVWLIASEERTGRYIP